jgi:DnaK suppressor protein
VRGDDSLGSTTYVRGARDRLDELRAEIARQLEKLERSMRVTGESVEPVKLDQASVGRLSRIDSLQNQRLARNLQERERAKLAQIQAALKRLHARTHGLSTECGAGIPFGRLYVFPEAPTCASCG